MDGATTGRLLSQQQEPGASGDIDALRATCRHQADVVATLTRLNGDLAATAAVPAGPYVVRLPCDARASGSARAALTRHLGDRLPPARLDRARLLVSELVTIGVQYSVASPAAALILRVGHSEGEVLLDVRVPGDDGAVTAQDPVLDRGGSLALQMVDRLCDRWRLEHQDTGGIRVWGRLAPTIGRQNSE